MRLPRVRFTVRRLMIAVAIAGLIFGVLGSVRVIVHQMLGGRATAVSIDIDPLPLAITVVSFVALIVMRRRKDPMTPARAGPDAPRVGRGASGTNR